MFTNLRNALHERSRHWFTSTIRRVERPKARFARLMLEQLEQRLVLTDIAWNNPAGGDWELADNWSPTMVPGSADNAIITLDGTYTVNVGANHTVQSLTLGGATGTQTVAVNAGIFRETLPSTINATGVIKLNAGTFDDDGGLAMSGIFNWIGGTLGGTATTTIAVDGAMNLAGAAVKTIGSGHTIDNSGSILHGGSADLVGTAGATAETINNLAGAIYEFQVDAGITGSVVTFSNAGTIRKSGGTGESIMATNLTHAGGTIDVQVGKLTLTDSTTASTGSHFMVAAGAVLDLTGGASVTYNGTYTGEGGGRVELPGGEVRSTTGTTLNFPAGLFHWTGGDLNGSTFTNVGFITISGTGTRALDGANLENLGTIIQTDANQLIHIPTGSNTETVFNRAGGLFEIQGDLTTGAGLTFVNEGLLRKAGSSGESSFSSTFNATGGTIEVQTGRLKISRSGTADGAVLQVSAGAIVELATTQRYVLRGTLTGAGGGRVELTGLLQSDNTAPPVLNFPAGMLHWLGADFVGSFSNMGHLTFDGANSHEIRSSTSTPTTFTNTGTIIHQGTAPFLMFNTGAGATLANQGLYELRSDAGISIADGGGVGTTERVINTGTFRKAGGLGVSTFAYAGTDATLVFDNPGTVEILSGTFQIDEPVTQITGSTLTGGTWNIGPFSTLDISSAPDLTTNQGNITLTGPDAVFSNLVALASNEGTLELAGGQDFDTVGGFSNTGHLVLGAGSTLTVNGDFATSGSDTLAVEVAGRPDSGLFGRVDATGEATLDGKFRVTLAGGFEPVDGDVYELIRFPGGRTEGTFATLEGVEPLFEAVHDEFAFLLFVGAAPSVDLTVSAVSGPTMAVAGEVVRLEWTVTNSGSDVAIGPWHDRLSLSIVGPDTGIFAEDNVEAAQLVFDIDDILVGQGLQLESGQSAMFFADVRVPALAVGEYRWSVFTNSRSSVLEKEGRLNNLGFSATPVALDVALLAIGGAPVDGQFGAVLQPHWFRLEVPAERIVQVNLDLVGDGGVSELFLGRGFIPDRFHFTLRHQELGAPDVSALIPEGGVPETWYALLLPIRLAGPPTEFVVAAQIVPPRIDAVTPGVVGNSGPVTLQLSGLSLGDDLTYQLVGPSGVRQASRLLPGGSNRLFVTFDAAGLTPGSYSIAVSDATGSLSSLPNAVQVETGLAVDIELAISVPSRMRTGRQTSLLVSYKNTSNNDVALPFITVAASAGGNWRYLRNSVEGRESLTFLAPSIIPGLDAIPPGMTGDIRLYYTSADIEGPVDFNVWADTPSTPLFADFPIDWEAISQEIRPPGVTDEAWTAFLAGERARYGSTYGELFGYLKTRIADPTLQQARNAAFIEGQWLFDASPVGPVTNFRNGGETESDVFIASFSAPPSDGFRVGALEAEVSGGDGIQEIQAVVVGNEDYNDVDRWSNLPAAGSDAQKVQSLFEDTYNVPGENVETLVDEVGNSADDLSPEILTASIQQAIARAKDSDDIVVVWVGAHGVCPTNRELQQGQQPHTFLHKGQMTAADYDAAFAGANSKVLLVLDTCHAEAVAAEITNPLVSTITSTEWIQTAVDGSFTPLLVDALVKNPDADPFILAEGDVAVQAIKRKAGDGQTDAFGRVMPLSFEKTVAAFQYNEQNRMERFASWEEFKESGFRFEGLVTDEQRDLKISLGGAQFPVVDRKGIESLNFAERPDPKPSASSKVGEDQKDNDPEEGGEEDEGLGWFRTRGKSDIGRSFDPNLKVGPGIGAAGYVPADANLPYTVFFENDPILATLPAQVVRITDQLDADLDLTTFELTELAVGSFFVEVPSGLYAYSTRLDLSSSGIDLLVQIDAELDFATRIVIWTFTSIDPVTGQATEDPLAGFLPPNDEAGHGEGHVGYRIRPLAGSPTGTEIRSPATIRFDDNAPLNTNAYLNTIDDGDPSSSVNPLPAFSDMATFPVSWFGTDDASGPVGSDVAFFDVFVSDSGGPFELFLKATTDTSATFTGEFGHTYGFFSVATDQVGHREATSTAAQATTTLAANGPTIDQVPEIVSNGRGAMGVVLAFDEALDEASAETVANYRVAKSPGRDKRWGTDDDKLVALGTPVYDAIAQTVRLQWTTPLRFFRVTVDGTDSVLGTNGLPIDGDIDGTPGGDYVRFFAGGTKLSLTDQDGDRASLKLNGGGMLDAILLANGDPELLRIRGTIADRTVLSGAVQRPKRGTSDGIMHFRSLAVDAGRKFRSTLTNPPFRFGPLSQVEIDQLLVASDGTLAGVLIAQ